MQSILLLSKLCPFPNRACAPGSDAPKTSDPTQFVQHAPARVQSSAQMPQLPDPEHAVAQLHAAGDDIEALTEAIQAATFLKDTPGDARQKLRGARCCPWHAEATP